MYLGEFLKQANSNRIRIIIVLLILGCGYVWYSSVTMVKGGCVGITVLSDGTVLEELADEGLHMYNFLEKTMFSFRTYPGRLWAIREIRFANGYKRESKITLWFGIYPSHAVQLFKMCGLNCYDNFIIPIAQKHISDLTEKYQLKMYSTEAAYDTFSILCTNHLKEHFKPFGIDIESVTIEKNPYL